MDEEKILDLESKRMTSTNDALLDVLFKVSGKLYEAENFERVFSPYVFLRLLSLRDDNINYAIALQDVAEALSKKDLYRLAYKIVPKISNNYIGYIGKPPKSEQTSGINSTEELTIFDI